VGEYRKYVGGEFVLLEVEACDLLEFDNFDVVA